jgi:ribosomal protein S18 acetylase RimI-like enzyme
MPISNVSIDSWLGSHLGRPVFRIGLDNGDEADIPVELQQNRAFAYTKVATDQVSHCAYLQAVGFRLVDTLVSLQRPVLITDAEMPEIGFATSGDEEKVSALAHDAFTLTRFHLDPNIANEIADNIKENWARNFFLHKRGDYMVVARDGDRVTGFVQLLLSDDGTLTIDLVAVAADMKGCGIAKKMTAFAEREIKRVKRLNVGTQVANTPALRAYTDMGFRPVGSQYIWHFHNL